MWPDVLPSLPDQFATAPPMESAAAAELCKHNDSSRPRPQSESRIAGLGTSGPDKGSSRAQCPSDVDSGTPVRSETAAPASAAVAAAAAASAFHAAMPPGLDPGPAVCVCQSQLPIQHRDQHQEPLTPPPPSQQQQQQLDSQSIAGNGAGSASQQMNGSLQTKHKAPDCGAVAALATTRQRRGRPQPSTVFSSPGSARKPSQIQQQPQQQQQKHPRRQQERPHILKGGGTAGGGSRAPSCGRQCAAPLRHLDASEGHGMRDVAKRREAGELELRSINDEGGKQASDEEADIRAAEEQSEEHMLGCGRCRFSPAGCSHCVLRPLASRPFARWKPAEGRFQEGVPSAPVFHPSVEEFADPLSYIAKIRPEAEKYGLCCIVPPPSCWDVPFDLSAGEVRDRSCYRFPVTRQCLSRLCVRPCSTGSDTQAGGGEQQQSGDRKQQTQQQDPKPQEPVGHARNQHKTRRQLQHQQHHRKGPQQKQQTHQPPLKKCRWQTEAATDAEASKTGCDSGPPQALTPGGFLFDGSTASRASVPLVAPTSNPHPRPPSAAVEESLRRYLAGRGPHPLLAGDGKEAAAAALAAAALAAPVPAGSSGRRTGVGRPQRRLVGDDGDAAGGVACAGRWSRSCRIGRAAQAAASRPAGQVAPAASASTSASSGSSGEDWGSESDGSGESPSEQIHTLESFRAYCTWVRGLHFGLPPLGDRLSGKAPAVERQGGSDGPKRQSSSQTPGAGLSESTPATEPRAAIPTVTLPQPDPPKLQAAVVHAAAGYEPSLEELEAEFWRIVERPTGNRVVETLYANELDSARYGSGFPLPLWRARAAGGPAPPAGSPKAAGSVDERMRRYASHPWSPHNLPFAKGSLLRYIEADQPINGVMSPRLRVGGCLSASCWHAEELALYSLHYLHVGAPRVWYGVPPHAAEQFEAAIRDAVPQLICQEPQQLLLKHQAEIHVSPRELRRRGVPVCRLVQTAGSFVVTFPRAHHSGFDCGFNCTEAVNFAPADWLPFGCDEDVRCRGHGQRSALIMDRLLVRLVSAAAAVSQARQAAAAPASPALDALSPGMPGNGKAKGAELLENWQTQQDKQQGQQQRAQAVVVKVKSEADCDAVVDAEEGSHGQVKDSWQAGVRLADVSPPAVCAAVGELTLRLEQEVRWHGAARELGVLQRPIWDGLSPAEVPALAGCGTCAPDLVCLQCKRDLYLSAVMSPDRTGVATCPEHAASLGCTPETCVLLYRHSLEELRALLNAALEHFPEGHAAVATARQRLAAPPLKAIRRLGPLSKYGVPYWRPLDERDAEDAACSTVCAVAGPVEDSPYMPYDPDLGCGRGVAEAVDHGRQAPATATTTLELKIVEALTGSQEWLIAARAAAAAVGSGGAAPAGAPTAVGLTALTAAVAAVASPQLPGSPKSCEREQRVGPRQALLMEEQQAEAERRADQRRAQESMRRARAQRAARRSTAAAATVGTSQCQPTAQRSAAAPPATAVLRVPAVAVISPAPFVRPPPVFTAADVQAPPLTDLPLPAPPAAATVDVPTSNGSPLRDTTPQEMPLAAPATVPAAPPAAAAVTAACPPDPPAWGQGIKRSSRGTLPAGAGPAAAESDRLVRPRRERRVPKHLLDAEMELADEMRHVVSGASSVSVSGSAVAVVALPQSPAPPASPATVVTSAGAAAGKASPVKTRGPLCMASPLGSAASLQELQLQQAAVLSQLTSQGSCMETVALPSPTRETEVPEAQAADVNFGGQELPEEATTTALQPSSPLLQAPSPPSPSPPPHREEEQQKQVAEAAHPTVSQLQALQRLERPTPPPKQQSQDDLQLRQQRHSPQQPLLQQPPPSLPQPTVPQQEHHAEPPSELKAQEQPLQGTEARIVPAAGADAKPPCGRAAATAAVDELGASPRRSSRPTRPSVRLLSVTGGATSGTGAAGAGAAAAPPASAAAAVVAPAAVAAAAASPSAAAAAAPPQAAQPVAAQAPPLPAAVPTCVVLLRRETTSGPSTSLRSLQAAGRRVSLGPSAGVALGSLPPTAATGPGAAVSAVGTATLAHLAHQQPPQPPQRPQPPSPQPPQQVQPPSPHQVQLMGVAAGGVQSPPVAATKAFDLLGPSGKTTMGGEAAVCCTSGGGATPLPRQEPAALEEPSAPAPSKSPSGGDRPCREGTPASKLLAVPTGSTSFGQPSGAPGAVDAERSEDMHIQPLPSPPQKAQAATSTAPRLECLGTLGDDKMSRRTRDQPPETVVGAAPQPLPPAQAPPHSQSPSGRPVRKRKAALSNDMVVYGESAALFGAITVPCGGAAAKRKSGGDRRVLAVAAAAGSSNPDGSGGGSTAGAGGAGSGAGGGAGPMSKVSSAAAADLHDMHHSLGSFPDDDDDEEEEEELGPIAATLSPPHTLFGGLHHLPMPTPPSPPIRLTLSLTEPLPMSVPLVGMGLRHCLSARAVICSGSAGAGLGPAALGATGVRAEPQACGAAQLTEPRLCIELELGDAVVGAIAPHSPAFLGPHDAIHDPDADVFMAEAGGRSLALSASPSASALDALAPGMPPARCDSPLVLLAGFGSLAQARAEGPEREAGSDEGGGAAGCGCAGAGAGAGPALPVVKEPQSPPPGTRTGPAHEVVTPAAGVSMGTSAPCSTVRNSPEQQQVDLEGTGLGRDAFEVGKAASAGLADAGKGPGQALGAPGALAGTAVDVALAALADPGQSLSMLPPEPAVTSGPAVAVAEGGSRQALSSLSGVAFGEWADLDDLVAL